MRSILWFTFSNIRLLIKMNHKVMKNIAMFVTVLMAVPGMAQTQYGLKGGVNYSNLQTNADFERELFELDWRPSVHIGTYGIWPLSKHLSVIPEFLLSDKGFRSNRYSIHLLYAEVILMLRHDLTKKLTLDGGGGVCYLLTSFATQKVDSAPDNSRQWGNKFDFKVSIGVNYLLSSRFGLTFRYDQGLSNVLTKENDPLANPPSWRAAGYVPRNMNFQLSANYLLKKQQSIK
jgi:hypothetical protein